MSVAHHEAGHALACILTDTPLDYVTVIPTHKTGGHAQASTPNNWWRTPGWFAYGITTAAGMAGEAAALSSFGHTRGCRPRVVDAGAGGSTPFYDVATLRWIARAAWNSVHNEGTPAAALGPEFNPAWATDPDGVRAIAAHCWQAAVRMMCQHAGTISDLAHVLADADTLTGDQVAAIVHDQDDPWPIAPELVGTDFWLADHSRLVWRPYGACRQTAGAR